MNERLPLDSRVERKADGYAVSLTVRSETVHVSKRIVVAERIVIRTQLSTESARVDTTARRERLKVDVQGDTAVEPVPRRRR